jgi:hypothetical protein
MIGISKFTKLFLAAITQEIISNLLTTKGECFPFTAIGDPAKNLSRVANLITLAAQQDQANPLS